MIFLSNFVPKTCQDAFLQQVSCCISITFSTLSSNSRYSFADQHRFGHFHADSSLPRPVSSTRSSFRGHGKEAFRSILLLPPLALQCFFHLSIKISILLESKSFFKAQVYSFLKPMSMNQSQTVRRTDPKPFCPSTIWVLKKAAAITKCSKIPRLDRLLQCLMLFKLQQLMHTLGKSLTKNFF